jgi:flagellar basal body rod protein FlgG
MTLYGRVDNSTDDPLNISVRGMTEQLYLMNVYTDNIAYGNTPGYQRKIPVVTTFAEHLGWQGVDIATDTSIGQNYRTGHVLDVALSSKGYFQKLQSDGRVELTRDGRFQLDKEGNLLSVDKMPVLSRDGVPIKLPTIPDQMNRIKINQDGWIEVINPQAGTSDKIAQIGVAMQNGDKLAKPEMHQGFVEASNVFMYEEPIGLVPPRRNFAANRQIFLMHSQSLTRLIQEMGRTQ